MPADLDDAAVPAADELVGSRVLAVTDEPLTPGLEVCQHDRALVRACNVGNLAEELRTRLADPDVDLAAARKPDAQGEVVRDAVGEQTRATAAQNIHRGLVDLVLHAATRHGSRQLAPRRNGELRAHRAWRRPSRRNDGCQGYAVPASPPATDIREKLFHEAIVARRFGRPGGRKVPGLAASRAARMAFVSWLMIALLALAVAAVVGAEWPRLTSRFGAEARARRERVRRKASLTLVRSETEEFEASVQRDLAELPTIEESDRPNR